MEAVVQLNDMGGQMNKTVQSVRFGELEYIDDDVVTFPKGLPAFESLTHFLLLEPDESYPYKWMQSIDSPEICFLMIDPVVLEPRYMVMMKDVDAELLDISRIEDAMILAMVTIGNTPQDATANFLAPVVINVNSKTCSSDYSRTR